MIRVEIINTFLVNKGKEFVILLQGTGDEKRTLPISIGQLEAQSIALQLNKIPIPRPLTHDLLKSIITSLNGKVARTEIYQLKDETFFATLVLEIGNTVLSIEARPSDAIAMSLRFDAPLFVEDNVMDEAGVFIATNQVDDAETEQQSAISDEAFFQQEPISVELFRRQLAKAIEDERYEDAARLRDEINKQTSSN